MLIHISHQITISGCPEDLLARLKNELTIPNPKYLEALKQGRWTGHLPQNLRFYREEKGTLTIPRGMLDHLREAAAESGTDICLKDGRTTLPRLDLSFSGRLRPAQAPAVRKALERSQGIIKAATCAGKTVMALSILCTRDQPTLIVVPNKTLLHQWIRDLETFLGLPREEVGILGDGFHRVSDTVTVGIINTVAKTMETIHHRFGHVIIDEVHRAVSALYQEALKHVSSRYLLGLSATPYRRDGLTRLLEFSIGGIVAEVDTGHLLSSGHLVSAETQWVRTGFSGTVDASADYPGAIRELTRDLERNRLICRIIASDPSSGPSLILSDRKEHCRILQEMLDREHGIQAEVLVGGLDQAVQQSVLDRLRDASCRHLIGTSQLLGEGFDLPALEVLYLTVPFRFRGKLIQNIGRILRASGGKTAARIYDFVDTRVGVFKSSALARVKTYTDAGIRNLKAVGEKDPPALE